MPKVDTKIAIYNFNKRCYNSKCVKRKLVINCACNIDSYKNKIPNDLTAIPDYQNKYR